MKKVLLLTAFFCLMFNGFSQEVIIDEDVSERYSSNKGPNERHYGHFYLGIGAIPDFDEETGSKINFWRSGNIVFGYRYKLKLLSFYAWGFDASYSQHNYFMGDDSDNPYNPLNPLTLTTDEKKYVITNNDFSLEFYQRINFGKRGNSLGYYLDLGVSGQWNFMVKELVKQELDSNQAYYKKSRDVRRNPRYNEPFGYSAVGRIGIERWVIYGVYRISDYFNDDYVIPELPRLSVGAQYSFK